MISLVQGAPKSLQFQRQTSFGPNLETPPVSDPWDVGLFHGFITSHSLKHVETWNSPRDPGAHRGPTWGPCSKSGGTWRDFLHNYQHSLRGGAMIQMLICQYTCVFYIYIYIIKYYFFFISCAIHLSYFVITYLGFHVFSKSWCLSGVSFRPVGMVGIRLTMADVSPKA